MISIGHQHWAILLATTNEIIRAVCYYSAWSITIDIHMYESDQLDFDWTDGRTDGQTHGRTDGTRFNVPLELRSAGDNNSK